MVKILLATGNPHKARELSAMLSGCDVEVLTLKDVGFAGEIIEDGETFEENAEIKARAAASLGYIGVGDDSGLCVDFLGGAPGVYSARYAGEPCDNSKNNEKLLSEMAGVPEDKRGAKFVCVICCVFPDGRKIVSRGECPGRILTSYAGSGRLWVRSAVLLYGKRKKLRRDDGRRKKFRKSQSESNEGFFG